MQDPIIHQSKAYLYDQLLPKWLNFGFNSTNNLSYERLQLDWQPLHIGQRRLLSQCRQLYTFSHAYQQTSRQDFLEPLAPLFDSILEHYFVDDHWCFAVNDKLVISDHRIDTYTLAFVILSFSHYYTVTHDVRAEQHVETVHRLLSETLRADSGGFHESYPIETHEIRRQNPHMHLLEGYLAAYEVFKRADYRAMIEELADLALQKFYHSESNTLREFFDYDWQLDTTKGHIVEPGHFFEWVWLLHETYDVTKQQPLIHLADQLWEGAQRIGLSSNGGIFNQVDGNTGRVLDRNKRIWPITEYLKAITKAPISTLDKQFHLQDTLKFMHKYYFHSNGGWNEYLDEQNQAVKDANLPATTSYHIFLGLSEAFKHLETSKLEPYQSFNKIEQQS